MDSFNTEFTAIEQRDLFPFLNNEIFGDGPNSVLNHSSPSNSESSPLSSPHHMIYSTPLDGNLPSNSIDPKNLLLDDDMLMENHGLKRPHPDSDDEALDVAHMTAAEIKELKAKLSPEDLKEIKKKRRKLKNRESAQLSRQRKKLYVDELEQKVDFLAAKNKDLTSKVSTLSTENKSLKEEVDRLQNLVKQSSALNSVFENVQNIKKNQQVSSNVKAAGVCLAIVLFSFGLFFNEPQANNNSDAAGQMNISPALANALNPLQSGNFMFSPDQMTVGTSSSSVSRGARVLNSVNSEENECELSSAESGNGEQSNNVKPEKKCSPKNKRTEHPINDQPHKMTDSIEIAAHTTTTTTTTTTIPAAPPVTTTTTTAVPNRCSDPFGSVSGLARGLSSLSGSLISDFARTQVPSKKSHIFWAEAFKFAGNENEESSLLLVPLTSQNKMLACGIDG